jgi:hypothetical protein
MVSYETRRLRQQVAARQARNGRPERDALFLTSGQHDPNKPFLHFEKRTEHDKK